MKTKATGWALSKFITTSKKTFKSWAPRIDKRFWLLKYGRFICLRFCLLHVQPALAQQKPLCNNLCFYCCAGFSGHDQGVSKISYCHFQNSRRTHSSPQQKFNLHLFCSKTASPASQRLEKICTSWQLDWSRSELIKNKATILTHLKTLAASRSSYGNSGESMVFWSSRGFRNAITIRFTTQLPMAWKPSGPVVNHAETPKTAHLDVHPV